MTITCPCGRTHTISVRSDSGEPGAGGGFQQRKPRKSRYGASLQTMVLGALAAHGEACDFDWIKRRCEVKSERRIRPETILTALRELCQRGAVRQVGADWGLR